MSFNVRSYKLNEEGRDLVVGDIHGEYRKLSAILKSIHFDVKKDRLFSVGDLCDRGNHSKDLLQWMEYEWFIPVMGNHELMIMNHYYGYLSEEYMRTIQADWFLSITEEEKAKICYYFNHLPIGIEIIKEKSKVGIVHAMCPLNSWEEFKETLSSNDESNKKSEMASKAMWSIISKTKIEYVHDVEAIIVGHNTMKDFCIKENTYMLDTGSGYKTGKLTILDLKTMKPI